MRPLWLLLKGTSVPMIESLKNEVSMELSYQTRYLARLEK